MRFCAVAPLAAALLLVALAVPALGAEAPGLALSETDGSSYPQVRLRLGIPAELLSGGGSGEPKFQVVENGVPVDVAKVTPVGRTTDPIEVVLVIDTSGSMKGAPIEAAKSAALRFIDTLGSEAQVAVVGFSSRPRVVTSFTSDRARLANAISSLAPDGETSVYDALVTASKMRSGGKARHAIVLLSDGGDTVSVTSLDDAIRALKTASVPVYAVALSSPEFNPKALGIITKRTGGRLAQAKNADSIGDYFQGIAEQLTTVYDVTYASRRPNTKDLELDVVAELAGKKAALRTSVVNPMYAGPPDLGDTGLTPITGSGLTQLVATTFLAFAAVTLLVGGAGLILIPETTQLRQLRYYDQLQATAESEGSGTGGVRNRLVDAVGAAAGRGGFTDLFRGKLERAGLAVRPAEYITMHLLLVITLGVAARLLSSRLWVALLVVLITTVVPLWLLEYLGERRIRAFEEQLPDVLNLVAGSLRAGWGMLQAIDLAAREVRQPAAGELRRAETEARLGVPVENALQVMADRIGSADFAWAVTAIAVQREVGGNLAEVLDIVANTVRERGALKRQIQALTAEGRFSAIMLSCLPFFLIVALLVVNPGYISMLWTTTLGLLISLLCVLLLIVGTIWLSRAIRIEV